MTNDDRLLLEAAARAAGIEGAYFHGDNPIHCGIYQACGEYYWNPLISDSEALRLAVKLGIDISFSPIHHQGARTHASHWDRKMKAVTELDIDNNDNPLAATRRAIVRAAASMDPGERHV